MKGLILPGEIEIRMKNLQCIKKTILTKLKIIFVMIFTINIKSFLSILLIKKKKILTTKYFHPKLMISIFTIDIIYYTIIFLSLII